MRKWDATTFARWVLVVARNEVPTEISKSKTRPVASGSFALLFGLLSFIFVSVSVVCTGTAASARLNYLYGPDSSINGYTSTVYPGHFGRTYFIVCYYN